MVSSRLTVCVLIQLPESHTSDCLSAAPSFLHNVLFVQLSTHISLPLPPRLSVSLSVHPRASRSSSPPRMSTSHIHYRVALAQSALFPSVVLNYSVFLGQALVSSHCNDFLIICLYVMNEMEMYHHGQTGWRCAKLPHQSQGGWEQGGVSNRTNNIRL